MGEEPLIAGSHRAADLLKVPLGLGVAGVELLMRRFNRIKKLPKISPKSQIQIQGGAGGLAVGWVDLDLECSTILLGQ